MEEIKNPSYEEMRQKRMEENKKRIEQLNLTKLAQSLHTVKPFPMKRTKVNVPKPRQPVDSSSIRRSSRVADKPPVNYKENVRIESEGRSRTGSKRDLSGRVDASEENRAYAKQRAENLQSSLGQNIPSFVKSMLQSHVTGGCWLGLPAEFCKKHCPKRDETMYLINEKGEKFKNKYIARKTGLSGGWGPFARLHKLVDGDAVVFQLTKRTTFKVYIIRANKPGE